MSLSLFRTKNGERFSCLLNYHFLYTWLGTILSTCSQCHLYYMTCHNDSVSLAKTNCGSTLWYNDYQNQTWSLLVDSYLLAYKGQLASFLGYNRVRGRRLLTLAGHRLVFRNRKLRGKEMINTAMQDLDSFTLGVQRSPLPINHADIILASCHVLESRILESNM